MRLFVGLVPPTAALDDLDAACAPFRLARDDLRWTGRELWHLTLAFLGEVSEEDLARLMPWLGRAAGRSRAFSLSVAGGGAFSNPARANVLWSGMSGDRPALAELAATVADAARGAGIVPPDAYRGFTPHLTLAVQEIYLIRSTLDRRPRYETLETWKLRSAA